MGSSWEGFINPELEKRRQKAKQYKARLPGRDTGPHQPKDYKQYVFKEALEMSSRSQF